ncbi:pyrophosphate-energized vacuolar membrane proton pump-like [Forsythia ovata]|uniref:H(+)-exporting diphosphatase n=1 Tax=Forsythia ovata TaxID=205694 RepID=A0ABD1RYJ6_9LAMI
MKIVGSAALKMVEEVCRQFNTVHILMEVHSAVYVGFSLGWCFRACKNPQPKGSEPHKAVIGYTIGDPLMDTPSLSLNILIKLMAVESLLFTLFIAAHGGMLFKI